MKLRNDTDSVAYVIGMNVGANLLKMDSTINVERRLRRHPRHVPRQSQTLGGRCRDVLSELRELRPSRRRHAPMRSSSSSTSPSRTAPMPARRRA